MFVFANMRGMPAGDATARLHEAIDLVAGIDVSELPTADGLGELLEELTCCLRRLDFEIHRLLRSFEARGDHVPLGYRTAKQWCQDRLRTSDAWAGQALKLGRVLVEMPTVSAKWAAGELGAEHASAVSSVRTEDTREAFGEWEGWLAQQAVDLDMRGLRKVLAKWRLEVDPGCDEPERIERDRDAHVSTTFQGPSSSTASSTPSGVRRSRPCSTGSSKSCSRPTGPKPSSASAVIRSRASWPAPRPSVVPMPWCSWPNGPTRRIRPRQPGSGRW